MSESHSHSGGCCSCSHDRPLENEIENDNARHSHGEGGAKKAGFEFFNRELLPIAVVVVLFVGGLIFQEPLQNTPYSIGEYLVFIPAYLIGGWSVLTNAGRNILRGRLLDENFLMAVATLGAIAIRELPEAVGVMLFFQIGEMLQERAVKNSRRSIQSLLDARPDYANLQKNGSLEKVHPDRVEIGDIILVKPGEKIPLDGEVIAGKSRVDTSALTGESVPRSVGVGKSVLAGSINQESLLTVRTTKAFGESSIARILDLVKNARSKKAKTEKFMTQFARIYTPGVVLASLAVATIPPLLIPGATVAEWGYRALVLLVISCPCGLVISIPLGYFGGVGGAAKRGILVKGSTFLDALAQTKTVVFDKTGTLTRGVFKVKQVVPSNNFSPEKLLQLAAEAELHSNHPVARSIREAYGKPIETQVLAYEEIAGHGIRAKVNGATVLAGNDRLLHRENIPHDTCEVPGTSVYLAVDNLYAGNIAIADELKEDAAASIRALKKLGVERVAMLTGDNREVAAGIAKELGIDFYHAELLPEEKVDAIEKLLMSSEQGGKIAFVGDGINDAPALARADVGIAMGGLGSDAAIETADIAIMTDAPSKVAEAIAIGKKTRRIVWQNIALALGAKAAFITLGIFGLASLWAAVFADVGVALLAILNASRVLGK
ncbi:MAG: cadmium-translocating P-type ATPase [Oscillatoria sp. SIO1A7]|nr:cadmium-translocating P-type ATPase [Oscillatoria sp. SIO1A7]